MRKRIISLVITIMYCSYFSLSIGGSELPKIERQPQPLDFMRGELQEFPQYALGCQVKKDLTPAEFWKKALSTASFIDIKKGDITYRLGPIVNPVVLIDSLAK